MAGGAGGAPAVPDVCPVGRLAVQSYPFGRESPISPLAGISLARLVPKSTAIPLPYPLALITIRTYPVSTIVKTNVPTVIIADLVVKVYPKATIAASITIPTATIACKPSL